VPELPSGVVTFVFTDIEGSTRLFRRLGDAYPPLLQRHNQLLRAVWEQHGGGHRSLAVCTGAQRRSVVSAGRIEMEDQMADELMEFKEEQTLSREAAAARLRELADQLARHNQVEFKQDGIRYSVMVPDEVKLKIEVEVGAKSEIEFELTW
jgi:amphi-Trp domain-containing protein